MAESNNQKRAGITHVDLASQLWFAVLGSAHADWLGLLAQAALAVLLSSSYANACLMVAAVLAIRLIGGFLLEPVGRVAAARLDRRWAVVGCDAARAAMFLTVPLVGATWWLLLAAFLGELATSVRVPLVRVATPAFGSTGRLAGVNQPSPLTLPFAAGVFTLLALVSRALGTGVSFFDRHPTDLAFWFAAAQCVAAAVVWALATYAVEHAPMPGRTPPTALSRLPAGIAALTPSAFAATGGLVLGTGAIAGLAMIYAVSLGGGPVTFGLTIFALCVGGALGIVRRPSAAGTAGTATDRAAAASVGVAVAASGFVTAALGVIPVPAVVIPLTALAGWWAGRGWTALRDSLDDPRANAATQVVPRVGLAVVPPLAALLAAPIGLTAVWLGDTGVSYNGDSVILFAAGVITLGLGGTAYALAGGDVRRDLRGLRPGRAVRATPTSASNIGFFIALEGGDGAGKSTQATALAAWLTEKGHEVVSTREPGGTELGERLRALLLDVGNTDVIGDRAEALLYAADRADHVERVILPALRRGAIVVTDRYVDSSIAYQGGGRDIPSNEIADISAWATTGLVPNLTVILDLPPDVARGRAGARRMPADRLESEDAAFHTRVREAYLARAAAEPQRYLVVDATASPEAITELIQKRLAGALPLSDKERAEIAEAERKAREEAERRRAEEEKRKAEQQALVERLKAEAEARAAERARQEAEARAELERLERERLEQERKAREEAERERAAREAEAARIEAERLAKERAEAERLAKERAAREAREAEERRKRLEEEARKAAEQAKERAKVAALRQRAEQRAEAERAAARAAEAMALAESREPETDDTTPTGEPAAAEDANAPTVTVPAVTAELPNNALVETAELTLADELLNMNPAADEGKKKRRR